LAPHYPLNTQMVYILSLGVVKEYRRHGVGVLLFIFTSVLLSEAEFVVMRLYCQLPYCNVVGKVVKLDLSSYSTIKS